MAFDPKKPVQTRDGRSARIIATDVKGECPIIALVALSNGAEAPYSYYADGSVRQLALHPRDLVNVPEKRTITIKRWVALYNDGRNYTFGFNPAECDRHQCSRANKHMFAVREIDLEITFTEGEGLTNG
jgi:hypothetical protein